MLSLLPSYRTGTLWGRHRLRSASSERIHLPRVQTLIDQQSSAFCELMHSVEQSDVCSGRLSLNTSGRRLRRSFPTVTNTTRRCFYDRLQMSWLTYLLTYLRFVTHVCVGSCCAFRLIWLVIFLVASALFAYLVAVKFMYLFSYPKNVNVDFNFIASLPFPAVTICNESPYRYM